MKIDVSVSRQSGDQIMIASQDNGYAIVPVTVEPYASLVASDVATVPTWGGEPLYPRHSIQMEQAEYERLRSITREVSRRERKARNRHHEAIWREVQG